MTNTIKIDRVKKTDMGTVRFTLVYNNVYIYGCSIGTAKETGRKFVSFPSYKGSDDVYYNNCYVKLTDDETARILSKIDKILGAE